MRITIFGCKDTTLHVSRSLIVEGAEIDLVTISPQKAEMNLVAGYEDLSKYRNLFRSIYTAREYSLKSESDHQHFRGGDQSVGFAIGWQRLIPREVLESFSSGVFGMHGSARDLPYGRGRSPLNWALIEGRRWFFTNLFRYEIGMDSGPVVGTECFSINASDTAETLHYKNLVSFVNIVKTHWTEWQGGSVEAVPQRQGRASFYPKRTPQDGIIDWKDDVFAIERLVRAVTRPFFGAYSYLDAVKVTIYRAAVFYTDLEVHSFRTAAAGEICDVFPNGKFLVKASGGVLIVHEYEPSDAGPDWIVPRSRLSSPESEIKIFERNRHGFFDIEAE